MVRLDVRAARITDEMKIAAVYALKQLAKEPVPEDVLVAYGLQELAFGRDYIIPKPLDERLLGAVSAAVAKAAVDSVVRLPYPSHYPLEKIEGYRFLDTVSSDKKNPLPNRRFETWAFSSGVLRSLEDIVGYGSSASLDWIVSTVGAALGTFSVRKISKIASRSLGCASKPVVGLIFTETSPSGCGRCVSG